MATLEIIGVPQSTYVRVVRIAAEEKGAAYEVTPVGPHTPDVDAISPFGRIPVMRHGGVTLCEARAIVEYIDGAFPGPRLAPSDAVARAKVEQWISLINTGYDRALVRDYLLPYVFPGTPDGKPDRARIDAAAPEMQKRLRELDRAVASGFLVGDSFTMADAFLIPILHYLQQMPESGAVMKESRGLTSYMERHRTRASVETTAPPPPKN